MRRYLLDTSPLAALLLARPAAVALITPWMERHEAATSILVYAEVVEYMKGRSDFSTRHAHLRTLLGEVYPYFLTYRILERYADLRRSLRPPHGPGQTPPRHPCHQWELKPTGSSRGKSPLGTRHFLPYTRSMYYML